jgi:hypothetical protein
MPRCPVMRKQAISHIFFLPPRTHSVKKKIDKPFMSVTLDKELSVNCTSIMISLPNTFCHTFDKAPVTRQRKVVVTALVDGDRAFAECQI